MADLTSIFGGVYTLPEPKRASSVVEIRRQFREHKEISADEIENLLEKANSSLGYLKIIAPRSKVGTGQQTGVTRIVSCCGALVLLPAPSSTATSVIVGKPADVGVRNEFQ